MLGARFVLTFLAAVVSNGVWSSATAQSASCARPPCSAVVSDSALASSAPTGARFAELHPIKVAPNTYYVQGATAMASPENRNFISNAGFVITDQGVVVVDALGSPALAEALVLAIGKLTAQPIRKVIVTHYHADHIYGLQVLKHKARKSSRTFWASRI